MFGIRVFAKGLDRLLRSARSSMRTRRVRREFTKMVDDVAERTKEMTPKRSGELAESTMTEIERTPVGYRGTIYQGAENEDGVEYGGFVRSGTRAHRIRPKRKKALYFEINGEPVYAILVRHPGTAPDDYPSRVMAETRDLRSRTTRKIRRLLLK